jgi:hypothetical protein
MQAPIGPELQACGAHWKCKGQGLVVGTACIPAKLPTKRAILIKGRGHRDCRDQLLEVANNLGKVFVAVGTGHLEVTSKRAAGR